MSECVVRANEWDETEADGQFELLGLMSLLLEPRRGKLGNRRLFKCKNAIVLIDNSKAKLIPFPSAGDL